MRKVKCKYWIPAIFEGKHDFLDRQAVKEGTGCLSQEVIGYFHEWGKQSNEGGGDSVGIVELENGKIHLIDPQLIEFLPTEI